MDVLALAAIHGHVGFGSNLAACNLGKFGLDVEGEGTKLLHVDALALTKVLVKVGDEGPPDYLHLRLGLQDRLASVGPLSGTVVLAWVGAGVLEDAVARNDS